MLVFALIVSSLAPPNDVAPRYRVVERNLYPAGVIYGIEDAAGTWHSEAYPLASLRPKLRASRQVESPGASGRR